MAVEQIFSVGDTVRCIEPIGGWKNAHKGGAGWVRGKIFTITRIDTYQPISSCVAWSDTFQGGVFFDSLESCQLVDIKKAKWAISYKNPTDHIEYFIDTKEKGKRVGEILNDRAVDKNSIIIFEIAKIWKAKQQISFEKI